MRPRPRCPPLSGGLLCPTYPGYLPGAGKTRSSPAGADSPETNR